MRQEKGILTKRARYVADMAELLAERCESYEEVIDSKIENGRGDLVYEGYDVSQVNSGTNIERMILQLRAELLELWRMA